MSAKWQGLVQEKLFLAQSLLKQIEPPEIASIKESKRPHDVGLKAALIQGAVALMLQAREGLLVHVAHLNQSNAVSIVDLNALSTELGNSQPDVIRLIGLSRTRGSWWQELDALDQWQRQPREIPKRPRDDDLIAMTSDGPDTSPQALLQLTNEFKRYLGELCQRHDEW